MIEYDRGLWPPSMLAGTRKCMPQLFKDVTILALACAFSAMTWLIQTECLLGQCTFYPLPSTVGSGCEQNPQSLSNFKITLLKPKHFQTTVII